MDARTKNRLDLETLRLYRGLVRRLYETFDERDDASRYELIVALHAVDPELAESLALDEHGDLKAFPWGRDAVRLV